MEDMAAPQDTFVRFVDSLAAHLDDHEARGADLAERMHLSRFHFDRVVCAVSGESPARFRRRVLLERAMTNRAYDWSAEEHESIDAMRERLARVAPAFLGEAREVIADGRLDETFVDALCEPAEVFTYGGMIAHVLTFAAHNRTLVVLALKKAGVDDLGWGDPMRWVAEPA
jgi:AraC-like DNA-binding protein